MDVEASSDIETTNKEHAMNREQAMNSPPTTLSSKNGDQILTKPNASPEKKHQMLEINFTNDQEISGIAPELNESPRKFSTSTAAQSVGAGDTSITDDEIEVICRYSSPKIDTIHLEPEELQTEDTPLTECPVLEGNITEIAMMPVPPNQQIQEVSNGQVRQEQPPVCNPAIYPQLFYAPMMMPQQEPQDSTTDMGRQTPTVEINGQFLPANYGQSPNIPPQQFVTIPYSIPVQGMVPPLCYGDTRNYIPSPVPGQITEAIHGQLPNMYGFVQGPQPHHTDDTSEEAVNQEAEAEPCKPLPPYPTFDQPLPFCHQMDAHQSNMYPRFSEEPLPPQPEVQTFMYPSIYVSNSGLITVLLKHDVSVEMTIDRSIRVVSHNQKMAVATNSRGTSSILHHPSAKVYQVHTTTDLDVNDVQAKMTTNYVAFGSESSCYKFDFHNIEVASLLHFTDLTNDKTVDLLFASEAFGSNMVNQCLHVAGMAEYENLPKGGVIIRINGVKITQTGRGDVSVVNGPKFLKLSPWMGAMRINTHFAEIVIDKDGILNVHRGNHEVNTSNGCMVLSNGKIEAGFDSEGKLNAWTLPKRTPLEVTRDQRKPRPGNPRRKATALGGHY